jgi:CPA2 family monovalent cation:H+ antiporter-2
LAIFVELVVVILFATVGGLIAARFRQPPVVGLLIIGALIGPHALQLVHESTVINAFADLGAVLLLFTIGVEFSISKMLELGLKTIAITLLKMGFCFFVAYEASLLMGFNLVTSLLIGSIIAVTSTALTVKLLEQKSLISHFDAPLLVAVLIVEDVLAVLALTFFSSLKYGTQNSIDLVFSFAIAVAVLGVVYFAVLIFLTPFIRWVTKYQAGDLIPLIALGLVAGMSYLAQAVGLSLSIGAFLAGSIIPALPKGEVLERSITPFALAFSSIFFLSMGMLVNADMISASLLVVIALVVLNIVAKFVGMSVSTYLAGFSSRTAVFSGLAMLSVGEFSLIIAKEGASLAKGIDIVGLTATLVLTSALASAVLLERSDRLHSMFRILLPEGTKSIGRNVAVYLRDVARDLEPGGLLYRATMDRTRKILFAIVAIAAIIGVFLVARAVLQATEITAFGRVLSATTLVAQVLVIAALVPLLFLTREIKELLDAVSSVFVRSAHTSMRHRVASDLMKAGAITIIALNLPVIFSLLSLPIQTHVLSIILLCIAFVFVWDASKAIHR